MHVAHGGWFLNMQVGDESAWENFRHKGKKKALADMNPIFLLLPFCRGGWGRWRIPRLASSSTGLDSRAVLPEPIGKLFIFSNQNQHAGILHRSPGRFCVGKSSRIDQRRSTSTRTSHHGKVCNFGHGLDLAREPRGSLFCDQLRWDFNPGRRPVGSDMIWPLIKRPPGCPLHKDKKWLDASHRGSH
jgi:hypothetical protein